MFVDMCYASELLTGDEQTQKASPAHVAKGATSGPQHKTPETHKAEAQRRFLKILSLRGPRRMSFDVGGV